MILTYDAKSLEALPRASIFDPILQNWHNATLPVRDLRSLALLCADRLKDNTMETGKNNKLPYEARHTGGFYKPNFYKPNIKNVEGKGKLWLLRGS
jgi:hypothetical protein